MTNRQISWTQADVTETCEHIFTHVDTQLKILLPAIGQYVAQEIKKAVEPLKARINELEMTGIKFVGSYQRAQAYRRGDVCNHDGGMWVSTCDTPPMEVPGHSVCWQLSVKSSSNGGAQRLPTKGGARPQTTVEKRT